MLDSEARLLFVLPELFRSSGGIQTVGRDMLRAVAGMKTHPHPYPVVVANDGAESAAPARAFNGHYRFAWCGSPRYARKARLVMSTGWAALAQRPSLVVCGHVSYAPLCARLKSLLGVPYLLMAYGIEVWRLESPVQRRAVQAAARVMAVSRFTADRLREQVSLAAGQVVAQPHPVRDEFRPGPKPRHLLERFGLEGKPVVLTAARLARSERYKGYDRVIEALPAVAARVPEVRYVLLGAGDDLPRVRALALTCGVADRVVFAGTAPEGAMADYYNLSDLFVMPSRSEGQGLVYLEALACGRPVIGGDAAGAREALRGGELGLLVDPDDVPGLAEAMVRVLTGEADGALTDPQRLHAEVRRHFGLDAYRATLERVITAAMGGGPP